MQPRLRLYKLPTLMTDTTFLRSTVIVVESTKSEYNSESESSGSESKSAGSESEFTNFRFFQFKSE